MDGSDSAGHSNYREVSQSDALCWDSGTRSIAMFQYRGFVVLSMIAGHNAGLYWPYHREILRLQVEHHRGTLRG